MRFLVSTMMKIDDDKTMTVIVQINSDFGDFYDDYCDLTWDSCSAQLVRSIVFAFSMLAA